MTKYYKNSVSVVTHRFRVFNLPESIGFALIVVLNLVAFRVEAQIEIQNHVLATCGNTFTSGSMVIDQTVGEVFTASLSNGTQLSITQGFQQPMRKKIGFIDPVFVSVEEGNITDFSVYPNPFRGELTVEIPENRSVTFQLFDNTGRLILVDQLSQVTTNIDLSTLSVGNYQLVLQTNDAFLGRISLIKSH